MSNLEMKNSQNNYVLYDRCGKNLSYFMIKEEEGEIVQFLRLGILTTDSEAELPVFCIRAYDKSETTKKCDKSIEVINFTVKKEQSLYEHLYKLASSIGKNSIPSTHFLGQRKECVHTTFTEETVTITISKDSSESKKLVPFMDISLGSNDDCELYDEVLELYQSLGCVAIGEIYEKNMEKVLTMQ